MDQGFNHKIIMLPKKFKSVLMFIYSSIHLSILKKEEEIINMVQ